MTKATSHLPALLTLSVSLRTARTARRVGLRRLADKLGIPPQTLSHWETAKRRPSSEDVAHILGFLRASPAEYDRVMRLCRELDNPTFIEPLEPDTVSLGRTFEEIAVRTLEWAPHIIPERLRTPEYLRAILQGRATRPDDIDQEIFAHNVRQLDRHRSGHHTILLGAAALEPPIESQLHAILTTADGPGITVRIVPASACVTGTIEPFTVYETQGKVFTVALRNEANTIFLSNPDIVKHYRSTFTALEREAISCADHQAAAGRE